MKDIYSKIDKERNYNLDEAIDLIKNSPAAKFEETLDIAINFVDSAFALMVIPTMIGTILLSPKVMTESKRYFSTL